MHIRAAGEKKKEKEKGFTQQQQIMAYKINNISVPFTFLANSLSFFLSIFNVDNIHINLAVSNSFSCSLLIVGIYGCAHITHVKFITVITVLI